MTCLKNFNQLLPFTKVLLIKACNDPVNHYLEVGELAEVAKAPPELWLPVIDAVDTGFFTWKKVKESFRYRKLSIEHYRIDFV